MKISKQILNKIKYLCREIPKVEWSGVLFYKVKGSITKPETFECIITDILPMDMGTSAYTEYEFNQDVVDYIEQDDERFDWKIGHIHSHNTMKTYFSATDMSELNDNSEFHNYYLSLIVNNFMDMVAKIAYRAEADGFSYRATDEWGNTYIKQIKMVEQLMMIHDCDIEVPEVSLKVPDYFAESVKKIKIPKPKVETSVIGFDWNEPVKKDAVDWDTSDSEYNFLTDLDDIKASVEPFGVYMLTGVHMNNNFDICDAVDALEELPNSELKFHIAEVKESYNTRLNDFYSGIVELGSTFELIIVKGVIEDLSYVTNNKELKELIKFLNLKINKHEHSRFKI